MVEKYAAYISSSLTGKSANIIHLYLFGLKREVCTFHTKYSMQWQTP